MKKEIRDKRNELRVRSKMLQELAFDESKKQEIRETQKQVYKRWQFYDKMIKTTEKISNERSM